MSNYAGILFAFVALVCWGFGDFFIQKTTRVVGTAKALFFIGIVGFVGLFPFIRNDLASLDATDALLLGFLGLIVIGPHFLVLEALRKGKIAIIEPIIGLELPITVALSVGIAKEVLTPPQFFLIGTVFTGIMLAIMARPVHFRSGDSVLEKGVWFAIVGAAGMALTNFLVGISSRASSPLVTI